MLEILLFFAVLAACFMPLGAYMARVYQGREVWLSRVLAPVERLFYRAAGIRADAGMSWKTYGGAVMVFSLASFVLLYALLMFQHVLPLNPQGFAAPPAHMAFNIAVSFVTNTNWQSYSGEQALSYFSQMIGLAVQNFLSPAVGMAVAVAVFRAFSLRKSEHIGNFWVDMVRGVLYILLPLSIVYALLLASQGVVQNFTPYVQAQTVEGAQQLIATGPAASQIAIKQLGSNGGGFFGANSAHPFENPTPFSNFLEMLAILLIPVSFVHTFGMMVGDRRQGFAILAAMTLLFLPLAGAAVMQEARVAPSLAALPVDTGAGNMEGKEQRFGASLSALWAAATTATSNGSANASHDSFQPLSGMVPMLLMMLGEVVYGGVGSGIAGMLIFVVITVFIGALMVGRTPEYLGKKLGPFDIKMASLVILLPSVLTIAGMMLAVTVEAGKAAPLNEGAQGFSEIAYAFASAANNNGSAFGGLSASGAFYNTLLGIIIFLGRYLILLSILALAGSVAAKNITPVGAGTLPTHTPLFVALLICVVLMMGVLTFIPVLALGPVAEHLHLFSGAL